MVKKTDIKRFNKDNELWDKKRLGASAEHAVPCSPEVSQAVDDALGLQLLSFRIQKSVIEQLKELSKLEGIGYQPLMRKIICDYVRQNEYKLASAHSLSQSAQQADNLLSLAIKLEQKISKLAPLSADRISLENEHALSLQQALALFSEIFDKSQNLVQKAHARKRIEQIEELCKRQIKVTEKNARRSIS